VANPVHREADQRVFTKPVYGVTLFLPMTEFRRAGRKKPNVGIAIEGATFAILSRVMRMRDVMGITNVSPFVPASAQLSEEQQAGTLRRLDIIKSLLASSGRSERAVAQAARATDVSAATVCLWPKFHREGGLNPRPRKRR
jgi:hypothetical protein